MDRYVLGRDGSLYICVTSVRYFVCYIQAKVCSIVPMFSCFYCCCV